MTGLVYYIMMFCLPQTEIFPCSVFYREIYFERTTKQYNRPEGAFTKSSRGYRCIDSSVSCPRRLSLACLRDEFESWPTRYGSGVRGVSGIRQGTPDAVEKLRGTDLYRGWIGATVRPETPFWHSSTV